MKTKERRVGGIYIERDKEKERQSYRQHTDIRTYRYTNIQIYEHTDIRTYRYTNMQIYKHTDIRTYRYTNIQIDRVKQTDRHTHTHCWANLIGREADRKEGRQ